MLFNRAHLFKQHSGEIMINIERRKHYIYLEFSEPYTREKFFSISNSVLEICEKENFKKILVNIQNMPGRILAMERFEMGVQGALLFSHKATIAVVYRKEEIDGFAETVGVNRGLSGRIFSEMDKALEWLGVE